jgi:hypothetical protein
MDNLINIRTGLPFLGVKPFESGTFQWYKPIKVAENKLLIMQRFKLLLAEFNPAQQHQFLSDTKRPGCESGM